MHMWGDGFDFDRLNKAGKQIENIFRELTGLQLHWKEKYGTIRYEWFSDPKADRNSYDWLSHPDTTNKDFIFAVMLTVADYSDLAPEIMSDFLFHNKWEEINKHRKNRKIEEDE